VRHVVDINIVADAYSLDYLPQAAARSSGGSKLSID
jgi:hypothetical protein